MANPWDNDPIVAPAPAATGAMPWESDPIVQPKSAPKPSTWERVKSTAADVGQALPTGIIKGAIGLAGLPGDVAGLLGRGADAAAEYITGQPVPAKLNSSVADAVGSARLTKGFEALTGELYKPQTTAGKFAQTVGEFIPSAGRGVANQLRFAVAPGVASEAAGQALEGTPLETPARAVAAVATGGLAALTARPNTAQAAVAGSMRGVDDATVTAAGQLMQVV